MTHSSLKNYLKLFSFFFISSTPPTFVYSFFHTNYHHPVINAKRHIKDLTIKDHFLIGKCS